MILVTTTMDNDTMPDVGNNATLERLNREILKIAQSSGDFSTAIPAVTVHRRDDITEPMPCIYELGLAVTVSGRKYVTSSKEIFEYGPGGALLTSVDMPAVTRVTLASKSEPYLGIMIRLSPTLIAKVSSEMPRIHHMGKSEPVGIMQGTVNVEVLDIILRLMKLFDEPDLLNTLSPLFLHEIVARLLCHRHFGSQLMLMNSGISPSRTIAQSMTWLKQHFTEAVNIEELAQMFNMSSSTFRQHFKSVSGMSPLQYLKRLKLQEARQMMLDKNIDASTAGLSVGYESISQFNREYARLFGQPPLRDMKQLRQEAPFV